MYINTKIVTTITCIVVSSFAKRKHKYKNHVQVSDYG